MDQHSLLLYEITNKPKECQLWRKPKHLLHHVCSLVALWGKTFRVKFMSKGLLCLNLLLKVDSIAVSVFEVILVEFYKYWIWDEQACLTEDSDTHEVYTLHTAQVCTDVYNVHPKMKTGWHTWGVLHTAQRTSPPLHHTTSMPYSLKCTIPSPPYNFRAI